MAMLVIFEVEGSAAQQNSSITDHIKAPSECATTKNGSWYAALIILIEKEFKNKIKYFSY